MSPAITTTEPPRCEAQRSEPHCATRDQLIEEARPMVTRLARRAIRRGSRASLEDLESAGVLGLVKAAQKYQADKGPFVPWAITWIQAEMTEESRHIGVISLPRAARKVAALLGAESTSSDAELAAEHHTSAAAIRGIKQLRGGRAPVELAATALTGDSCADLEELDPETREAIIEALLAIPYHLAHLIRLRLGLYPGKTPATLETVSGMIGQTREQVRQLQLEAFAQLRRKLKDFAL